MNISQCKHKSGQMLQAVKQSLTWMPESFDARFPFSVYSFMVSTWYRCALICLASSQNSNVWRPNVHVWAHFEPIFSLRVQGGIQTTVSQLAGVRGCRRKRQLSFFAVGCWLFIYWCSEDHNGSFRRVGTAFSGELPQAWTALLFVSHSGQIISRINLLTRRRKQYQVCTSYRLLCVIEIN